MKKTCTFFSDDVQFIAFHSIFYIMKTWLLKLCLPVDLTIFGDPKVEVTQPQNALEMVMIIFDEKLTMDGNLVSYCPQKPG